MTRPRSSRAEPAAASRSCEHAEGEDCLRNVGRPRAKDSRGKVPMVRRVGKVLRLETEAGALWVDVAAFAGPAGQLIPRIKLDTGFGRADVERAAARRVDHACCMPQAVAAMQHEIMIVTIAVS